jgi:hypothetical protein
MKIYIKWLPGFKPAIKTISLAFWCGLIGVFADVKAQTYPDFRHVCAQGVGNDISLSWSPLTDTCGGFKKLYIYGRVDALQPFKLIDSINTLAQSQYTHVNAKITSTSWSYFLVYKFLCNGDSAFSKTLAIDFNQPGTSVLDSVSVDINTGNVIVGWSPNPAPDLMSYVVWKNQGVNNIPIDTLDTTFFIHTSSSPNSGVQSYALTAVDSCSNQSVISTPHRTMFLQHSYDTCAKSITINWSAYVGWISILSYDIYAKVNSGGFAIATTNNPSQLSYVFTNFTQGDTVEFFIRAKEGTKGFTSSSNKITVKTRARKNSGTNYISYATVADSTSIELKLLCDTASDTEKYSIYRKKEDEGFFKLTDIVYDKVAKNIIYTDNTVLPYKYAYQYKYISTDFCNKTLDTSNTVTTIFLSVESTDTDNKLNWNRYNLWDAGVNQYSVYRGFDFGSGFTWNILSTIANTDSLYNDSNFPLDVGIAGTCYYIEADENVGNKYGEQSTSKSNTVCLVEDASIYFPNAFAPGKVNTLFLPVGANIDYNRSNMLIYARNGQLMKKIDNVSQGWDGTNLDGAMCPSGVYIYICEVFGLNEKKYNFKGSVHLLQ